MGSFIYENFIQVLNYDFYRTAIIASFLVSISTALMSVVIVNKNWAMLGMGLSNSVLPGVIIGSQLGFFLSMSLGAFLTGLLCFYLTYFVIRHSRLKTDAALGMCYSSFFALGLILLGFVHTKMHITHILFGNLLGIYTRDFVSLSIICGFVFLFSIVKYRDIMLFTFDEQQFHILGLKFKTFNNIMLVMLTLTIVASLQAIGILLTISYLVLPACTGQLISKRQGKVIAIGIASSLISSYFGITAAYILDITTGPSIVVLQAIIFLCAFAYRKIHDNKVRKQLTTARLEEVGAISSTN